MTQQNYEVGAFNNALREFDARTRGEHGECSVGEAVAICERNAEINPAGRETWWRLALRIQDAARACGLPEKDFQPAEIPPTG